MASLFYSALALPICRSMKTVEWTNYSHGSKAKRIAAASGVDQVWVVGSWPLKGGYSIERYQPATK